MLILLLLASQIRSSRSLAMLILLLLSFPLASGLPRQLFLPFGEENGDKVVRYNQSEVIFEFPPVLALYVS